MPSSIVLELRRLGHDALRSLEAGNANARIPDDEVLDFAYGENRIVVTGNRKHFIRLHRAGGAHVGIVVYTDGHLPLPTAHRVHAALSDPRAEGRFLARVDGVGHRFTP